MPVSAANLRSLRQARRSLERARGKVDRNEVRITDLERQLTERTAGGASVDRLDGIQSRIDALRSERDALRRAVVRENQDLVRLRNRVAPRTLESAYTTLSGDTPIALMPVRLEYRYFHGDTTELKIRIYPQELQIDDHQEGLTSDEIAAGQTFWRQVIAARSSGEDEAAIWRGLVRVHGAGRARWTADQLRPLNLDEADTAAPDFPDVDAADDAALDAVVCCLPERWVVLGYRNGQEVARRFGRPVSELLAVNLVDEGDEEVLDDNQPPPDDDDEVPSAAGLDWLVDYDTALAAGMAITLTEDDDPQLAAGYDELLVVGVDWSRSADESAAAFESLLSGHRFEQGVELPPLGEATNLAESEDDIDARSDDRLTEFERRQADHLDPFDAPSPADGDADGVLLNDGLGLSANSPLLRVPGATRRRHAAQADMHAVLYEGTLGYFADQMLHPLVSDADVERLKRHFRRYIRPLGALPLLRVGDQPYGVLPVCHSRRFTAAANNIGNKIKQESDGWRDFWRKSAERAVPRIGASGDVDDDLLGILRMSARSTDFRIREVIGPTLVANFANLTAEHRFQEAIADVWMSLDALSAKPFVAEAALSRQHHRVRLPFVQRRTGAEPLDSDYLARIAEQVQKAGGFKEMLQRRLADPASVLEAIAIYSALLELGKSAARLSIHADPSRFRLSRLTARERELNDISDSVEPPTGIALVSNALDRQPAVSTGRAVVDEVANLMQSDSASPVIERTILRPARQFEAALKRLSGHSTRELEMLLTGALDSLSHRLDCWISSLANQRLEELRAGNARGLYLGGFGWLDDVRPGPPDTGRGLTLAPSLNHAKAAAVLKSAHAAHAGDDRKLLSVDLSSKRVRTALQLVEGLRQGQTAGALLGYRLERDLQDRRLSLVQYVGPLRKIAPLGQVNQSPPGTALETIEVRTVVDGLRILELWRDNPDFFADHPELPQDGRDRADINRSLAALDDTLDALNDLMLAESVYQYVNGNTERATSALDAMERQTQFPEPEIAATPRGAKVYHYRLLVTLADDGLPSSWQGARALASEPRARVEPRLNSWIGKLLGDPGKYQFMGTAFADVAKKVAGVTTVERSDHQQTLTGTLDELGLHPAAIVAAATNPSADKPSELEARIERLLASKIDEALLPKGTVATGVAIAAESDSSDHIGFSGFSLLVRQIVEVLGSAEPGDASSLSPEDADVAGLDAAEYRQRVALAVEHFDEARSNLESGSLAARRAALEQLADHGVQDALPNADDAKLEAQVARVSAQLEDTRRRLDEHRSGFQRAQATAAEQIEHDRQTLKILYGEDFLSIPLCEVADRSQQEASLNNHEILLPGGADEVTEWLALIAHARPGAERLVHLATLSELVNGAESATGGSTHVIQLPFAPDEQWAALPIPEGGERAQANLSIVVHHTGATLNLAARQAVLAIDAWEDRIPDAAQDAAVTFQYDAPNARPPQTVLLAVPPEREQETWRFDDVVGAVREAKELGQIRMADLGHLDLLPRILPALYFPFDLDDEAISLNFGHAIEAGSLMNALNR